MDEEQQKLEQYDAKDRQRRIDESDKAVRKELYRISRVPLTQLSADDKAYLRSRATYLTSGEKDTYKDILRERPDLEKLTVKELKEIAVIHRVQDWDKLETKKELIEAIVDVQTA